MLTATGVFYSFSAPDHPHQILLVGSRKLTRDLLRRPKCPPEAPPHVTYFTDDQLGVDFAIRALRLVKAVS